MRSVDWSANGKYITSGSDDGTIRIWTSEGEHLRKISQNALVSISSVAFCYNNLIVSGSKDGSIQFWNRISGEAVRTPIVRNSAVNAITFSEDRTCVAAVYDDSLVCLWDVRTTCGIENHDVSSPPTIDLPDNYVTSIAFDSDGKRVVSGSNAGAVRVWDSKSGEGLTSWNKIGGSVFSVQFSKEWECVIAASRAGKLHVLYPDSDSRPDAQTIDITNDPRWPIAISPEGKDLSINIASPSPSEPEPGGNSCITVCSVRVSDVQSLEIGHLEGHKSQISAIAFSSRRL